MLKTPASQAFRELVGRIEKIEGEGCEKFLQLPWTHDVPTVAVAGREQGGGSGWSRAHANIKKAHVAQA